MNINRRHLILGSAIALTGGYASRSLYRFVQQGPTAHAHIVGNWDGYLDQAVNIFSKDVRQHVTAISETLLPRTDTPGAIDAGVPKFIELLYANWMHMDEREIFDQGLIDTNLHAQTKHQNAFVNLSPRHQKSTLESMEDAVSHAWFELGGPSIVDTPPSETVPFIVLFKEIAVTGFFMSEKGSTEVLRGGFAGEFIPDLPLSREDSSWAATPLV